MPFQRMKFQARYQHECVLNDQKRSVFQITVPRAGYCSLPQFRCREFSPLILIYSQISVCQAAAGQIYLCILFYTWALLGGKGGAAF